ncbi:similar to polyprotein [Rhizoctonia solani AG-1 IB]|uniref:Similar to polyprotein n=1 Tax=Thanatephorus cucumeris (strain AG1-IB / isolate 7/3/14) TaxID=1108050 RepID=A0A0B7FL05_THACB|nr:similar to polyprotein [Rhizoctonia solani AG-1 IB]
MTDIPRRQCTVCRIRSERNRCNGLQPCNWCSGKGRKPNECHYEDGSPPPESTPSRDPTPVDRTPTPPPPPPPRHTTPPRLPPAQPQPAPDRHVPAPAPAPAPDSDTRDKKSKRKKKKAAKRRKRRHHSSDDSSSSSDSDSDDSSSSSSSDSDSSDSSTERKKRRKRKKGKASRKSSGKSKDVLNGIRHRPDKDARDLAPAVGLMICRLAYRIFEEGWIIHLPLTILTDEYCASSEASKSTAEIVRVDGKGNLIKSQKDVPATAIAGETSLSLAQWLKAWSRLLNLISIYKPQLEKDWRAHFQLICYNDERDQFWPVWLRYDIELRERSTHEPLKVHYLQENIYKKHERNFYAAQLSNTHTSHLSHLHVPGPSITPPQRDLSGSGHRSKLPPAPFRPVLPRTDRPRPSTRCFRCRTTEGGSWTVGHSVTDSTAPVGVSPTGVTTLHTSVHYAGPTTMAHKNAPHNPRKIVTPLRAEAWEAELRILGLLNEFGDIPTSLRLGFRLGTSGLITSTYIPKNHASAISHPDAILDHINTELNAGRYSGPFSKSMLFDLIGPFRTAPLGVVDKSSSPGKFRIIQDFSYPRNDPLISSVNSQIDAKDFTCSWGFFADVANFILETHGDSEGATFDVDAAYRQIPVHPDDQPYIVVMWEENFYLDHAVPFGATSSNGLFGRCGDAMAAILSRRTSCRIFKWVDDFLIIRPPTHATDTLVTTTEDSIYAIAQPLGWPWKPSKTTPFASSFTYLGFEWNILSRTVKIPPKKCAKYLDRLHTWLSSSSVTLKDTQALIGTLIHCCLVIPDGRSRLTGVITFSSHFPQCWSKRFHRIQPSVQPRHEIEWWIKRLLEGPVHHTLSKPPPPNYMTIHSDASTSFGIGIVLDNHWSAWRLLQGWKSKDRGIGWAEAVGVELALEAVIAQGVSNASITMNCDNQGVVFAWKAGRSRNAEQNLVLMRITSRAAEHNLWLNLKYIDTSANLADKPSRGLLPPDLIHLFNPFTVPHHLINNLHPFHP